MLLVGVATLTLVGVARLLGYIALLLVVVAMLRDVRDRDALVFVVPTMVLTGVAKLLFGVAKLRDGDTLVGVAMLLYGVACLLTFGVGGCAMNMKVKSQRYRFYSTPGSGSARTPACSVVSGAVARPRWQ